MRGATRQLDRVADEATWPASVPSLPAGVEADLVKGLYRLGEHKARAPRASVRLVGSGTILREAIAAAELLASEWMIDCEVWSATSFAELARDAREAERWNRLHPAEPRRASHVSACLPGDVPRWRPRPAPMRSIAIAWIPIANRRGAASGDPCRGDAGATIPNEGGARRSRAGDLGVPGGFRPASSVDERERVHFVTHPAGAMAKVPARPVEMPRAVHTIAYGLTPSASSGVQTRTRKIPL